MKGVELYGRVRYAVQIEGLSHREAARRFGIDPRTVAKMMKFSAPPGYVRKKPPAKPGARLRWLCVGQARPCRKPPRALGASRLTSSFHFSRQRSPFARQEPLHRTRILPKPRRLRRFSISDARFALFNIKRDIAAASPTESAANAIIIRARRA